LLSSHVNFHWICRKFMPLRSQQKPPHSRRGHSGRDGSQVYLQRARASSRTARGQQSKTQNVHAETLSDTFELLQRKHRNKRSTGPRQKILLKSKVSSARPQTAPSATGGGANAEAPYTGGAPDREFETLQHRYRLAITDNRKLKSDNRYLHHKSQDLRSELEQKKRVCNELRESEKRLQQRLNILNGELDKQRRISAQRIEVEQMLKNRLKVMEKMHNKKIADLYRTIRQNSKADASVGLSAPRGSYESSEVANSLRAQVKEIHDRLDVRTKELQDEKRKWSNHVDEMQAQYAKDRARLQEAIASRETELSSERTKHQDAKVSIHRMKREIETLKAQVGENGTPGRATKKLKKTITKLNEEIEEHNRESAKLKLSVRNMSTKYEENQRKLKYAIKDLEETRKTLRDEREKNREKIQELRTENINEKKERRKMEAKYEMARQSGGGTGVAVASDAHLEKFAKERARIEDLEKETREALKKANKRIKENEKQNAKTKALYQKVIKEKGDLENKSLSQEMELDHLRGMCAELESENSSLTKKVEVLRQHKRRSDSIHSSNDKVKDLNRENTMLLEKLSDLQDNAFSQGKDSELMMKIQNILKGEPQLKGFDPDKAVQVLAQQARVLRQSKAKLENKLREESIKFEQEKIKLTNTIESLNEEIHDMSVVVTNATENSSDTTKQIVDLETEKRIMEEKIMQFEQSVLLSDSGSSNTRIAELELEIKSITRQKEDIAKEYADRMEEWESQRISQETNDVSVRTMIFALKREIESSNREKEATEHELVLYRQRFEEVQRLLAAEGYEIEYQGDDAEFYDEGSGGPGVFVEGYEDEEGDDEDAEEFMDEYFDKLRAKLRHELVGYVPSSSELEDVEYVLSKIDMLGLRNQAIEVKKLRPEDIKAVTNIKRQFDALPILEGYLEKYSPHLFAGWQRRWVVVRDYYLFWAKKEVVLENNSSPLKENNKEKFVNHIPLLTVQKILPDAKDPNKFVITGQDRKSGGVREYVWRIPSTHGQSERMTWIGGLQKHIDHLQLCMQWITTARSLNKSSNSRQSIRYASSPPRHNRSKRSSQISSTLSSKPGSDSGGSPLPVSRRSSSSNSHMEHLVSKLPF